jgi:hypothetical protein
LKALFIIVGTIASRDYEQRGVPELEGAELRGTAAAKERAMARGQVSKVLLSRRVFLGGAVASGALLAGTAGIGATSVLAAGKGTVTRYPLYFPPTFGLASPYVLAAQPSTIDLGGGNLSSAWVYNGLMPGPTFRARPGDVAQITLSNQLSEQTITHWHGMLVDHPNDGHPIYAIPPGATYQYSFPIIQNQRAALNWYHPHPHMLTGSRSRSDWPARSSSTTPRRTRSGCRAAPTSSRWWSVTPASAIPATCSTSPPAAASSAPFRWSTARATRI